MHRYVRQLITAIAIAAFSGWLAAPCPAAEPNQAPAESAPAVPVPVAVAPVVAVQQLDEVVEKRNLDYGDGAYDNEPEADRGFHKLDLYLPKGRKNFPVVVFVHGGAWLIGDKSDFGIYAAIGRMLASHGIGAVMVNYRLSPKVQHPEHIKDVARAFAWTHKHIAEYGGRPDRLFISGHSAGGHLAALLSTDESWLKAEGLKLTDVRGAMPISGVYSIPPRMFKDVFGTDPEVRTAASPTNHVCAGCPPFLIIYADRDFPLCDVMSADLAKALDGKGVSADTLAIKPRNHIDILAKLRHNDDPAAEALRDFVAKHAE
jgi:acetyl esterase/lipase